jgi:hypothetical protein
MIRAVFVITVLAVCSYYDGWTGAYSALIICGLLGALFPGHRRVREEPSGHDEKMWEKVEPARRGRSTDPTWPDDNEHPLMLTNVISRRR